MGISQIDRLVFTVSSTHSADAAPHDCVALAHEFSQRGPFALDAHMELRKAPDFHFVCEVEPGCPQAKRRCRFGVFSARFEGLLCTSCRCTKVGFNLCRHSVHLDSFVGLMCGAGRGDSAAPGVVFRAQVLKARGCISIGAQFAAAGDAAPANDKGPRLAGELMNLAQEVSEPLFIAEHSRLLGRGQVAERCSL